MTVRLKAKYKKAIKDNPELLCKIAQATGKSIRTVERWVTENTEQLTMQAVLTSVRDYMNLPVTVELTEPAKTAA